MDSENSEPFSVQVWLRFQDFGISVEEVLKDLPPVPKYARNRGERDPERDLPRSNVIVYHSSAESASASIDEHVKSIIGLFEPYMRGVERVLDLSGKVLCTIAVNAPEEFPVVYLERQFLQFLETCSAELEVIRLQDW